MMSRFITATLLLAVVGAELAACSSDQTSRSMYEGLRRREERIDVPGEDRRTVPGYDEYRRSRPRTDAPG
jgi:hypothetical protein